MKLTHTLIACLALALVSGCANTRGTVEERRQAVQEMKQTVLENLYEDKPDVRRQIADAPGYGVFSNANVKLILASVGGGYGVVTNNATGEETYMRMGEVGVGFGAGVRDFRVVMVFHSEQALDRFLEYGLTLGAQADAAAKASDSGGAVSMEGAVENMTFYQITESGLALQAMVKGARFWHDDELN